MEFTKKERLKIYEELLIIYNNNLDRTEYDRDSIVWSGLCYALQIHIGINYKKALDYDEIRLIFIELKLPNDSYISPSGNLPPRIKRLEEAINKIENSFTYKILKTLRVI